MAKRLTTATIYLARYRHNIAQLRRIIGKDTALMAVIKANAYGHGIARIAQAAASEGVEYLGVVSIGELEQVRRCGVQTPCLIINYLDESSIDEALRLQASVTAMDGSFIRAAQAVAANHNTTLKVHLKIDSGMHRAGCDPAEAVRLAQIITESDNLLLEGVFTHFAESDNPDQSFARRQLDIFWHCITALAAAQIQPRFIHVANSGAILTLPESHFSMVRAGIVTYGLSPLPVDHPLYSQMSQFSPVLELRSRIAHIRTVPTGETVGYNRTWRARRDSRIALIPIGYGDGFRRTPQHAPRVIIRGAYAPVVGAVSMDQITVDVTDIPDASSGDIVTIIGKERAASITAGDIAHDTGTIAHEVVTNLSERIDRQYITHDEVAEIPTVTSPHRL